MFYVSVACSAKLIYMEERAIKRLLIIFVISLIVIFIVKKIISRTIVDLNRIVAEKKQAAAKPPAVPQATPITSEPAMIFETPPVSTLGEATPLESPSVSGVGVSN